MEGGAVGLGSVGAVAPQARSCRSFPLLTNTDHRRTTVQDVSRMASSARNPRPIHWSEEFGNKGGEPTAATKGLESGMRYPATPGISGVGTEPCSSLGVNSGPT